MDLMVLALLGALWACVLVPGALRDRTRSPVASASAFQQAMGHLARRSAAASAPARERPGRQVLVVSRPRKLPLRRVRPVDRRRRRVAEALVAVVLFSLAAAVLLGGMTWGLPLIAGVGVGAYIAALSSLQRQAALRAKVHRLPVRPRPRAPEYDLRCARGA